MLAAKEAEQIAEDMSTRERWRRMLPEAAVDVLFGPLSDLGHVEAG